MRLWDVHSGQELRCLKGHTDKITSVAFSPDGNLIVSGSWDKTLLPLPFGKGLFLYGEPFRVPRGADEEEQERLRQSLEAELDRLTDAVDEATGIGVEEPREEAAGG